MLFAVGAATPDKVLHAVAVTGRPVARFLDDGQTAEVTRMTSDGTPNACSMLYAACWRAAKALGYTRPITYTQQWRVVAQRPAHSGWDRPARPRTDKGSAGVQRTLWEAA